MFKKSVIQTIQAYADEAKRNYEAGCVIAYNEALENLAGILKKHNRFGKKYALRGWQVVKI